MSFSPFSVSVHSHTHTHTHTHTHPSCEHDITSPQVVAGAPERVDDAATIAAAAVLANEVATNHSTEDFDASDVWRVTFTASVSTRGFPGY